MRNAKPPIFRPPWAPDPKAAAAARLKAWAAKKALTDTRPSAAERGYDQDWFRLAATIKRERPWCEDCTERGISTKTAVVDHVLSIKRRPDLRLARANLRALCKLCHNAKTIRVDGGLGKRPR